MSVSLDYLKRKARDRFPEITYKFIKSYYPTWKQESDATDLNFWVSWLITYSVEDRTRTEIEKTIYENVAKVMDGDKTFEEILEDIVPDDDDHTYEWRGVKVPERYAWAQIGKVAIRQGWVQLIKSIYHMQMIKMDNAESKDDLNYTLAFKGSPEIENSLYPPMPELG